MTVRTPSHEPVKVWSGSVRSELDTFIQWVRERETYAPVMGEIERLAEEFKRERGR